MRATIEEMVGASSLVNEVRRESGPDEEAIRAVEHALADSTANGDRLARELGDLMRSYGMPDTEPVAQLVMACANATSLRFALSALKAARKVPHPEECVRPAGISFH